LDWRVPSGSPASEHLAQRAARAGGDRREGRREGGKDDIGLSG